MSIIDSQFTRRFAPNCIDAKTLAPEVRQQIIDHSPDKMVIPVVLLDRVKEQIDKPFTKHQLFHGPQGLGKSTVARLKLGIDINNKPLPWSPYHAKYVNASKDARIDDLRTTIEAFCTNTSISDDGKLRKKVLFLDELDGIKSEATWDALRGLIDTYEATVFFVATCNHINRVFGPIRSRFEPVINFAPINDIESKELMDKTKKRLKQVWSNILKRTTTDEAIDLLANKTFPDIRAGLKSMQVLYENTTGELVANNVVSDMTSFRELYEFIFNKPTEEQMHVFLNVRYLERGYDVLQDIHTQFVDYIIGKQPDHKRYIGMINVLAAKYQHYLNTGVDQFLAMKACVAEISQIISKHA